MIEFHELANIFPLIKDNDFNELKNDISLNGQHEHIVLYENKILDGRNRYNACCELNIKPKYTEYIGIDPVSFVVSLNLIRRHLNESQRGMVAAKLANMCAGGDKKSHEYQTANLQFDITRADAAKKLNVSERTVNTAKKVQNTGASELINAVNSGKVSLNSAATIATEPEKVQLDIIAKGEKEIIKAAKDIKIKKAAKTKTANAELKKNTPKPVFSGKYDVLVIDPPWPMKKSDVEARPDNKGIIDYPTMDEKELSELDLPFNDDAHVFTWTTHKFLPMCLRLYETWGVKYGFTMVWHKNAGFQPMYYPQFNNEFVIYGRIGNPRFIDTKSFSTCFNAPRGKHSEKPELFYELLRRVTDGYRIDIFNRRSISGFDVWGNESLRK